MRDDRRRNRGGRDVPVRTRGGAVVNVWTDIAIGNLQRRAPDPREMEPRYICIRCGNEKPESDFRFADCGDYGFVREKTCRTCRNSAAREKYGGSRKPPPMGIAAVKALIVAMLRDHKQMSVRQMEARIPAGRRTVERAAAALREDRAIKQAGTKTYATNPNVPIYCLTQAGAAPAERIDE